MIKKVVIGGAAAALVVTGAASAASLDGAADKTLANGVVDIEGATLEGFEVTTDWAGDPHKMVNIVDSVTVDTNAPEGSYVELQFMKQDGTRHLGYVGPDWPGVNPADFQVDADGAVTIDVQAFRTIKTQDVTNVGITVSSDFGPVLP